MIPLSRMKSSKEALDHTDKHKCFEPFICGSCEADDTHGLYICIQPSASLHVIVNTQECRWVGACLLARYPINR